MIGTLFHVGPFRVHSYGVMLVIAFILGTWWTVRRAPGKGIDADRVFSLAGWILVSSVAGARLHFVLGHPESFASPLDLFRIWEGGLTLYGGLLAAIAVSYLYLRKHRVAFLPIADLMAPALALGEAVTRLGCFLNGCCFGSPHSGTLAIRYPPTSYAAQSLGDVHVHPAQLYLSVGMLLLFLLLWRLDGRGPRTGSLIGGYLVGQGLVRYLVDFVRHYDPVDRLPALEPLIGAKSQLVALLLAVVGILILLVRPRAGRKEAAGRAA
ncbi:MAG: prolipoprotein diacylglyceryl transferase [Candidatus Eisenbacteria bacterium]|nr:prolipoprotein diacylglyceryl transferase [Candidatus Eisenbacteria bacterium]